MIRTASRRARSRICRRHQSVGDDDVGFLEGAHRLEREQVRIAWPRTDQGHSARGGSTTVAQLALDQPCRLVVRAGQVGARDWAVEEPVPEPAPCEARGDVTGGTLAQARRPPHEPTQARRQHCLEPGFELSRQHRRRPFGADRHHERVAVDDRRRDEVAKLLPVDGIDRHAGCPRHPNGTSRRCVVFQRNVSQPDAGQVARHQRSLLQCHGTVSREARDFGARILRHHADTRLGLGQEPDLLRRLLAATDDQHGLMIQVQEHRKKAHPVVQHSSKA